MASRAHCWVLAIALGTVVAATSAGFGPRGLWLPADARALLAHSGGLALTAQQKRKLRLSRLPPCMADADPSWGIPDNPPQPRGIVEDLREPERLAAER